MPKENELESKIQELEAQLQAKEEELKKFWVDKEKITWTEEEVKKKRERKLLIESENKNNKLSTKEIWNYLIQKYYEEYQEQAVKVKISDLTDLALQVNEENIHDYEFLKQFCPEEPRLFFEVCKGLKYSILDQLANSVLARYLIEKYGEEWKEKGIYRAKKKTIDYLANRMLLCKWMKRIAKLDETKKIQMAKRKSQINFQQLQEAEQAKILLNTKIRELEQEKTQIKNQLTKEKTAALKNLEQDWQNWTEQERENWEQELRNREKERKQAEQKLTAKIASLEKSKAEIQKEISNQKEAENNKLRDKVNKKLEKGSIFIPGEQGKNLEEAADNLLDKQNKLENQIVDLRKEIQQHNNESEILRNEINQEISGRGQNLREAVNRMIKQKCRNEKFVPTTGEKCLQVATSPFRWVANKTSTGFALFGFATATPTILGGLGWMLKSYLMVKSGGARGAFSVANSMINRENYNQGENLPANYQPLPPDNNNNLPFQQGDNGKGTVINIHTLPSKEKAAKRTRKAPKKKKDSS